MARCEGEGAQRIAWLGKRCVVAEGTLKSSARACVGKESTRAKRRAHLCGVKVLALGALTQQVLKPVPPELPVLCVA